MSSLSNSLDSTHHLISQDLRWVHQKRETSKMCNVRGTPAPGPGLGITAKDLCKEQTEIGLFSG